MKRFTLTLAVLCLLGACHSGHAMSEHEQDKATIQALEKYQKMLNNRKAFGKIMRTALAYQNGMNQIIEVHKMGKNNVFATLYQYPNTLPIIVVQVKGKTINKAVVTGNPSDIFEALKQVTITALDPAARLIDVPAMENEESEAVNEDIQKTAIIDADISQEENAKTTETLKTYERLFKNQASWGPAIKISHSFANGMKEIIFKMGNTTRTLYIYKNLPACLVTDNNIKNALIMTGELKAIMDVIETQIRNEEHKSHSATVHTPNKTLQKPAKTVLPTIHEEAIEPKRMSEETRPATIANLNEHHQAPTKNYTHPPSDPANTLIVPQRKLPAPIRFTHPPSDPANTLIVPQRECRSCTHVASRAS